MIFCTLSLPQWHWCLSVNWLSLLPQIVCVYLSFIYLVQKNLQFLEPLMVCVSVTFYLKYCGYDDELDYVGRYIVLNTSAIYFVNQTIYFGWLVPTDASLYKVSDSKWGKSPLPPHKNLHTGLVYNCLLCADMMEFEVLTCRSELALVSMYNAVEP